MAKRDLTPGEILDALESSVSILRPGDVLVVTFDRHIDMAECDLIHSRLSAIVEDAGVRSVVLDGGAKVSVVRPEGEQA